MKRLLALMMAVCMVFALAVTASAAEGAGLEVVLDLDGEPSSLNAMNPGGSSASMMYRISCYGYLWRIGGSDEVFMDLAESYDVDVDNMLVTVVLKEGLMFADGSPLTAEDVVCSFVASQADAGNVTGSVDFERTKAVDERTVEIGLSSLSNALILDFGNVPIISKEWTEDGTNMEAKASNLLCSGPYVLEPWTTGNNLVMVKNENYWNAENVKFDKITVKCLADETTRFMDYGMGGVDCCLLTNSQNMDNVAAGLAPGSLCQVAVQCVCGFAMDTVNIDDFANQNLRLALCYGLDKELLVEAYCGSGCEVAVSCFPTASEFCLPGTDYQYDPELAQEYLNKYYEETGETSVEFTCTVKGGGIEADIVQAMQYQYQELGITMNIDIVDTATYFDRQNQGMLYSTMTPICKGHYDASKLFNSWRNITRNSIMHLGNEELSAMLEEIVSDVSVTHEERIQMVQELQTQLHEYGKFIPMYEEKSNWALNGAVETMEGAIDGSGYITYNFFMS